MPYIKQEDRKELMTRYANTAGELNYLITTLARDFLQMKGYRYEHINAIVGAMECAKLEFYARKARPLEDTKIKENGDVY